MQILKVASSQKLINKTKSNNHKGDLFAQIFENMTTAHSQQNQKIVTISNYHPTINHFTLNKNTNNGINNRRLLKKQPSNSNKTDKTLSPNQEYKKSPKISRNLKKTRKEIDYTNTNQHIETKPLINEDISSHNLPPANKYSKNKTKDRKYIETPERNKEIKPDQTKTLDKNSLVIHTNNADNSLTKTAVPDKKSEDTFQYKKHLEREFYSNHIAPPKKPSKKISPQQNHPEKTIYPTDNTYTPEKKGKPPETTTFQQDVQLIRFISPSSEKKFTSKTETNFQNSLFSENRQILYKTTEKKENLPNISPKTLRNEHSSNQKQKSSIEPHLKTTNKNKEPLVFSTSTDFNKNSQTQNINFSYKDTISASVKVSTVSTEKNIHKTEHLNFEKNNQNHENFQIKRQNLEFSENRKLKSQNSNYYSNHSKNHSRPVVNHKNKPKLETPPKKPYLEHTDKTAKTMEHMNQYEKQNEIPLENNFIQSLKIENSRNKKESPLKIISLQKENPYISHNTQNNFNHDGFSDTDKGIYQQYGNKHTEQEHAQEPYFQKQLSLNLRLENISLRATYHNGNLNLFMSLNETQLLNSLKTEIPGILKETGIKEYNLRIKSKEKEIRIFSKDRNYNTPSLSREINVRV